MVINKSTIKILLHCYRYDNYDVEMTAVTSGNVQAGAGSATGGAVAGSGFYQPPTSIPQQPIGRLSTTAGLSTYATGRYDFVPPTTVPGQFLSHSMG